MIDFNFVDSAQITVLELAKSMLKCAEDPDFDRISATARDEVFEINHHKFRAKGGVVFCGSEANQEYYLMEDGRVRSVTYWFDIGYDGAQPRTYDVSMTMEQLRVMACEAVNYADKKRKASKDLGAGI